MKRPLRVASRFLLLPMLCMPLACGGSEGGEGAVGSGGFATGGVMPSGGLPATGASTGTGAATTGGANVTGTGGTATAGASTGGTATGGASGSGSTITIEESAAGFCKYAGAIESDHTGYTGDGYINGNNASGNTITWSVNVLVAGSYTLSFRYANGATSARSVAMGIDDVLQPSTSAEPTGAWTTWAELTTDVALDVGQHTISLVAESAEGLPNIDSLQVTGTSVEPAACPSSTDPPNVFAVSSGLVEVWVNGESLGSTDSPGTLLSAAGTFVAGQQNIVAIRASKGSASVPYLAAELDGVFGRAGTSELWKAKAASNTDETTGSTWASSSYDDSSWGTATTTSSAPNFDELAEGPAEGIWSSSTSDTTALFRLRLYIPDNWSADAPMGLGHGVTGGEGGEVVTVTTPQELVNAVTSSNPMVVQVAGTIDFTGSEGTTSAEVCYQSQCSNGEYELISNNLGACDSSGASTFSYEYDSAGTSAMTVTSNKTIIGLGPNAAIVGKGFKLVSGVRNVIIRNLTLTDINPELIWGGDIIDLQGASNIWIDHNRFSLAGRQFLVTHYDASANVTVSFNDFDGNTPYSATCNGSHYWDMLLLGAGDTITMANNWIHNMSGRSPHAGGYDTANVSVHMVNDYHQTILGHACDAGVGGHLLYEGSYFENVTTPFTNNTDGSAYAPLGSTLSSTEAACSSALGRSCVANYTDSGSSTFRLDAAGLSAFSSIASEMVTPYPAAEVPHCVPHLAGPGHI